MTAQQIVDPSRIEAELLKIWEPLAKENKMRASLFNLIIFNKLSQRTDYIRKIVQKVVEKFPCRTLFISEDSTTGQNYLKTAVAVLFPGATENAFACDQIDIGVAGSNLHQVPSLLLPHLVPDLPIYLLWGEDPSQAHPLFEPLSQLAHRLIFDSEATDNLPAFAEKLLDLHERGGFEIADLNWARTEGWRDLLASVFQPPERREGLSTLSSVSFVYNSRTTESFCHLKIQSMYLLAWLASRLQWKWLETDKPPLFTLQGAKRTVEAQIQTARHEKLGPGTVISVDLTWENHHFFAARFPDQYHVVKVELSSNESCDLPYQYVLGQTATGQSLVKEICTKGTSAHYLGMLRELQGRKLC